MFILKTGDTLPAEDIISSHTAHSEIDCALHCLPSSTCVSFNYRPTESNKYAVNCQLSNKIRAKGQETSTKEKWKFYTDLKTVRKNYED